MQCILTQTFYWVTESTELLIDLHHSEEMTQPGRVCVTKWYFPQLSVVNNEHCGNRSAIMQRSDSTLKH